MGRLTRRNVSRWAATLMLTLVASSAAGQGFYYKEVRRDGRIYVFNLAVEADRFEQTGEMGRAITRPGVGPGGETVVADSERALQLFFFKYGIAEVVPEPPPPTAVKVEWRDGKTRVTTDSAYIEMSNRIQARYTHEFPDDATQLPGVAGPGDDRGSFRIRRAKLKFEGWIWKSWLTYEVQTNWANLASSFVGNALEDAALDIDFTRGKGLFRVHFGQFKVPFGHQELTSAMNQTFVDRAFAANEFFRGRDQGVAVWGTFGGNSFEYRAGVFNGGGVSRSSNDNDKFQYNARFMWQPNKSQSFNQRAWVSGPLYSESDFETTTTPIYAVAVNFEHNDYSNSTLGGALNNTRATVIGIDGQFKFKGLYLSTFYNWGRRTSTAGTGVEFDTNGYMIQASQMLDKKRTWEAAFRYSGVDLSSEIDNDRRDEVRGGLNYYYRRHAMKFQADVGRVTLQLGPGVVPPERKTFEVRVQTQFLF